MKKLKIYYSIPISIDWNQAMRAIQDISSRNYNKIHSHSFWHRNSHYSTSNIENCDVFCLILPNFSWGFKINDLPSGCKKELNLAESLGKKICILYTTKSSGQTYLYDANKIPCTYSNLPSYLLSCLGSTADNVFKFNQTDLTPCSDLTVVSNVCESTSSFEYDVRLLFLN